MYKINIENRDYNKYNIISIDNSNNISTQLTLCPIKNKLFNNDEFLYKNDKIEIVKSYIRDLCFIPAILLLTDNKTYGRQSKKNGKLLYKCIPDDLTLPAFLIPYEIKHAPFSKVYQNLYVVIVFANWDNQHPIGILSESIGEVNVLKNYYEYQIYCKKLNTSIKAFNSAINMTIKNSIVNNNTHSIINKMILKYPHMEHRTDNSWFVFSIDPFASVDFDDAFSIKTINDHTTLLSIYISNVTIYLDYFELWNAFSDRVSTIYLPNAKMPMLPTILSDNICSLVQNNTRFAFVMDMYISPNNEIESIKFSNCIIRVNKNYVYEEELLLSNVHYINIKKMALNLLPTYKFIDFIQESHDVVAYFMIFMNHYSALELMKFNQGIIRNTLIKQTTNLIEDLPKDLPHNIANVIKIWNAEQGQYTDISTSPLSTYHSSLKLQVYTHITSPIRRIVDLLNIIVFQKNAKMMSLSENAFNFYDKWSKRIEFINITFKNINKLQNNFALLNMCYNNDKCLSMQYNGIVINKTSSTKCVNGFEYQIYIHDLKLYSKINIKEELEIYHYYKFKLLLFENEYTFKKKIQLQYNQ